MRRLTAFSQGEIVTVTLRLSPGCFASLSCIPSESPQESPQDSLG